MKVRMMVIATLVTGVAAAEARAQAPWPIVFRDASVAVALDTAGLRRNPDASYRVRTRWDYTRAHRLESKRLYHQMTQTVLLRCSPTRIKRLTESFYAENGAVVREGDIPDQRDIRYMTWDRLIAGTEGSRAYTAVCRQITARARRR